MSAPVRCGGAVLVNPAAEHSPAPSPVENMKTEQLELERACKTEPAPLLRRLLGMGLLVGGSVMASTQGALISWMAALPSGQVAAFLGLYMSLLFLVLAQHHGVSLLRFRKVKWVVARCFAGGFALTLKTWSVQHLPYGDATALIFTMPLFTAVLARVWLKERLTVVHVCALLAGISGILLICKPSFLFTRAAPHFPGWYSAVPVLAALLMAVMYVVQRRISSSVHVLVVCWWQGLAQVLCAAAYWALFERALVNPACYLQRSLLLLCPLLGTAYIYCFNLALSLEKSSTASLFRNLDTVLAYSIQILAFNQPVEWLSLGGAALIVCGTVAIALVKACDVKCTIQI